MSKPTLLVSKMGGVFYTREKAKFNSSSGEQGETEGILRHLVQRDDINIVYFGETRGALPCPVVRANIGGFNEFTKHEEQVAGWEKDVADLTPYMPIIGHLQVAGYSPTMSTIDNPNAAIVQSVSIRYQAPGLHICEALKIPRLVVNNDPRTYPKDQEMSNGWVYARPRALLDQCESEVRQVVGGRRYIRRSIWARPESWAYHIRSTNTDENDCLIIAHAHIKDGCKQKGRNEAWLDVLGGNDLPTGLRVYGKGWEHYEGYTPQIFPGPVKPNEVMDLFCTSMCSPCVAAAPGFYTGKVYVCEAQGCIPLLYGDGSNPYTWDPKGAMLYLSSPHRIVKPGDLKNHVDMLRKSPDTRAEHREYWREKCKPHWEVLDAMVSDLVAGRDWNDTSWFDDYGGYRRDT